MKHPDWSSKLRSHLGTVDQRYSTPRLNANLGSEESALSTQMCCIPVMTTARAALDKCHNAGVNEGFEAWRQFVMEWEPKIRTRCVGLRMNVLGHKFRDDIPTNLATFERTIHEPIHKDRERRQTMLGVEDMPMKEHLIRNSVRITNWNQMREEILEITRTQQCINSQPKEQRKGQREEEERTLTTRWSHVECKKGHVLSTCRHVGQHREPRPRKREAP